MKKIINVFSTMLILIFFISTTVSAAGINSNTEYKFQKGIRKAVIYTSKINDIKDVKLNLQQCKIDDIQILNGKGRLFSDNVNWEFSFDKLKLYKNELYKGNAIFINKSTNKKVDGVIFIYPDKNIISGYIKEEKRLYFYSDSGKYDKEYIKQYIEQSKTNKNMNSFNVTSTVTYDDSNIVTQSKKSTIAAHFIGKPEIASSDERRFSFRIGLLNEVLGYYPQDCELSVQPVTPSGLNGLSVVHVYPYESLSPSVGISLGYESFPFTLDFSTQVNSYDIGNNFKRSYVNMNINDESLTYWNGECGVGDNKKGYAADFYIEMLNAEPNTTYSFNAWGVINVLDFWTGFIIPYETDKMTGNIKCSG